MLNIFKTWWKDVPSSLVVFLVALPLCLGVGLASTTVPDVPSLPNIMSGILAGIIGGIVVGSISKSRIGVSGPAAGLIMIVISSIASLGSFEGFLVCVVLAGIIQIIAGFLGLGIIGNYFPSSVIKGMLAAIGITLILKEIPHALGYDADFFGDESFVQYDGHNTFSELIYALKAFQPGAIIISVVSLGVLILFETNFMKKLSYIKFVPAALIVVILGILINAAFYYFANDLHVNGKHLVQLPVAKSFSEFKNYLFFPDFSFLKNPSVYGIALTIALVASLETLLSVEATDKLDPEKTRTPTNRELKAQGVGNIISGLIGGLPITQVIVRSSANVGAGAKSKLSTILHGFLLLISILFLPTVLNLIPLASLAMILIMVGYKLTKVQLFRQIYSHGYEQFIPFIATIVGVMFTDLLRGIGIGMAFAIFFILRRNYRNNYSIEVESGYDKHIITIQLSEEVTFLNKGSIIETLESLGNYSTVILDGTNCKEIDHDVLEVIENFKQFGAKEKKINLTTINIPSIQLEKV